MEDHLIRTIMYAIVVSRKSNYVRNLWMKRWNKRGYQESSEFIFNYCKNRINLSPEFKKFAEKLYREYLENMDLNRKYQIFKKTLKKQERLAPQEKNDICWVLTCYNELVYVKQCIASIRKNDGGKIILINDGGNEEGLKDLAEQYGATYINSSNYKIPQLGNEWWRRFFTLGFESGCQFVVKIDPDSYFVKPLEYSLTGMNFFGCTTDYQYRSVCLVQGGIQGFSRNLIHKILDLKIIDKYIGKGIRRDGSFSTDVFLETMFKEMVVFGEHWEEVMAVWGLRQKLVVKEDHNYSIIHPVGIIKDPKDFLISDLHVKRLNECGKCQYFDIVSKNCHQDGSYIYPITKIKDGVCPIGKW